MREPSRRCLRYAAPFSSNWPPHDFYARVLGVHGGRAAFLARLGSEVSDILDEFLTFALEHERSGLPGLQAFVSTLEIEAPTVKREQDKERDEVRIMTVHAAKGLEAPVVFLVDGGGKPFNSQHVPDLRFLEMPLADGSSYPLPVWRAPGSASNSLIAADSDRLKTLAEEEYRRLLYVGMTRAADRLVVCGYRGQRAKCRHLARHGAGEPCRRTRMAAAPLSPSRRVTRNGRAFLAGNACAARSAVR